MAVPKKTYYEVLEIGRNAELIDIKKAYRRLALKHHPDRNNGSTDSTEIFKEISEAYGVLSNPSSRGEYDLALKFPSSSNVATSSNPDKSESTSGVVHPSRFSPKEGVSDPFKQFDELFRNDPFFHGAFQDMNDVFSERFDNLKDEHRDDSEQCEDSGPLFLCGMPSNKKKKDNVRRVPWSEWLMNKLGIEISVTSYSHEADGSVLATSYTSKPSGTYTNKKTRTFIEDGRQITVMSMEKDGNTIEDKFISGELVERKVNGKIESIDQVVRD